DEVHGRHQLYFDSVRVQRIFARRQRLLPDSALARFDLLAIAESFTCEVFSFTSIVGDHYTDVTDRNQSLGTDLNGCKPTVDEKCSVRQHLKLFAPTASRGQKSLRVLKVVVVTIRSLYFRSNDFSRFNRKTVMNSDDSDRVDRRDSDVGAADGG